MTVWERELLAEIAVMERKIREAKVLLARLEDRLREERGQERLEHWLRTFSSMEGPVCGNRECPGFLDVRECPEFGGESA